MTTFPLATAPSTDPSGAPRGSANRAFIPLYSSRRARFSGEETYNARNGFPRVDGPMFTTCSRGLRSPRSV